MNDPLENPVIALIPAYNEALRVGDVIRRASAYLPVVVVDDGSVDTTTIVAESAGARVILQRPNQGKGAALRAGFRQMLDEGRQAVITLDADGQHDPDEIPGFLKMYEADHPAMIIGSRNFAQMPPVRRFANTLGGWLLSWAMGQRIRDNQSGYRLITRPLMEATLSSTEQGFEFEVEMIVTAIRLGLKIEWVPIRTIYAGESSHIHPWKHFKNFIRVALKARDKLRSSLPG
jgi:glycosyltransferase involved in cell wall biosynthesis